MEHRNLDALKALLVILQDAGVAKYHAGADGQIELEFHRPMVPLATPKLPTVPKDPVQEQLALRRPDYAKVFQQTGFPTHAPKDTPKAE